MLASGEMSYGDLTFEETHPGNIAAIASLVGLNPPGVEKCRVLELGCGTGFNLLAMGLSLPSGHFTGIDYDPIHIRRANEAAAAIGARNVEFHCLSIADFQREAASFDYVIAHGVYSWVPPAIRDSMLAVIRHSMAPNGIAYISYNTYPGWHLRSPLRDGLRYFADPRQALDDLTGSLINPDSLYARAMTSEWALTRKEPDYYITHEYLVSHSEPFYFHQFAHRAQDDQLQFAAEANFFANSFAQPEEVQTKLEPAGAGLVEREQYLDWLVGRYFRQTLLCHSSLAVETSPDPEALLKLNITLITANPSEATDDMFLEVIRQLEPGAWIPAHHIDLSGMPSEFVAAVLWSGWRDGLWSFRCGAPSAARAVSTRPIACPLARYQAAAGPTCTNRHHRRVQLNPEERQLIQTLDGTVEAADHPSIARLAAASLLIA
jgi:SAM-dependent methyltransferase